MAANPDVVIKGGADFSGIFGGFGKLLGKITDVVDKGTLIKTAFGTAFATAAYKIKDMIDDTIELNHQLAITSKRTGANVEDIQGWTKNAAKYGETIDDVTALLEKLELQREKALKEGPEGKLTKSFQRLGINRRELEELPADKLFKKMNEHLSQAGTTMNSMVYLADVFGAKMAKNTKFLEEDLEKAKKNLKDRGALIDENLSNQLESVRRLNKEMGTYGERLFRPEHRAEVGSAVLEAQTMLKNMFALFDETFSVGFKKAWENFGERAGRLQAATGTRMGQGALTTSDYERMAKANLEKISRHEGLKSDITELDKSLRDPMEVVADLQKDVIKREQELAKVRKKGSTEYLEAEKNLKQARLQLRDAEKALGTPTFSTNPFLQIGGLMGVDTNYRMLSLQEQIASNTEQIAANTAPQQTATTPTSQPLAATSVPNKDIGPLGINTLMNNGSSKQFTNWGGF